MLLLCVFTDNEDSFSSLSSFSVELSNSSHLGGELLVEMSLHFDIEHSSSSSVDAI